MSGVRTESPKFIKEIKRKRDAQHKKRFKCKNIFRQRVGIKIWLHLKRWVAPSINAAKSVGNVLKFFRREFFWKRLSGRLFNRRWKKLLDENEEEERADWRRVKVTQPWIIVHSGENKYYISLYSLTLTSLALAYLPGLCDLSMTLPNRRQDGSNHASLCVKVTQVNLSVLNIFDCVLINRPMWVLLFDKECLNQMHWRENLKGSHFHFTTTVSSMFACRLNYQTKSSCEDAMSKTWGIAM